MSTTVSSGSTATFGMDAFASLAVVPSANDTRGTITFTSAAPKSHSPSFTAKLQAKEFGPFLVPMSVSIVVQDGSCTYQLTGNAGGYSYNSSNNVVGLIGPDEETLILPMVLGQQASASSVTGTTAETVLYSLLMPIGTIIAGDILRVEPVWTYTNSANNKILAAKIGPTLGTAGTLHTRTRTTTAFEGPLLEIAVRTLSTQIQLYSLGGSYAGGTAGALNTHTFDFAVENTLYITGTLANSGETIALEAVKITRLRS